MATSSMSVVASMLAKNPSIVDEQRVLYDCVSSTNAIYCERWRLRVNEAKRNRMFEDLMVEAPEAIANGNTTLLGNSESFMPGRNDHKVGLSRSIIDHTFIANIDGQTVNSNKERTWERDVPISTEE